MPLKSVEIKDYVNFLKIESVNKTYYGGSQEWFKEDIHRKYGCAAVAASNLLAFKGIKENIKNLYSYKDLSKENFLSYMTEIISWVKPREKVGILNPRIFIEGLLKYCNYKNIKIDFNIMYFDRDFREISYFIKKALGDNKPIAMLILRNEYLKEFHWHWMTVTKYFQIGEKSYVVVSTWGEKRILDLNTICKYSNYGGLIYLN